MGVSKDSKSAIRKKETGVAFCRWQILTYNSRGRDTGLVEVGVGHRKECEFRKLLGWQKVGGNCYRHVWNDRIRPVCH